jgi:hypothetical protein
MEDPIRTDPSLRLPGDAAAALALNTEAHAEAEAITDEEQARRAREQYRDRGIPHLVPDEVVAPHLEAAERVLGTRSRATVARVDDESRSAVRDEGPLYVTSSRLLHLGQTVSSVSLKEIAELAMADDRILVTIAGGRGLMLDVSEPRQFRVLLAAARGAISREL